MRRGEFTPPEKSVTTWEYVNIDRASDPDFCCDAGAIPVPDAAYDQVVLCEVIEHLPEPERALQESYRVLRSGGELILSCPFLFPLHAAPADYQRWTAGKLNTMLASAGFKDIRTEPMGGTLAVIHDMLLVHLSGKGRLSHMLFRIAGPLLRVLDRYAHGEEKATTGYFARARK